MKRPRRLSRRFLKSISPLLLLAACKYQPVDPPPGLTPYSWEVAPPAPTPPPTGLEYTGDAVGFASRSDVLRGLSTEGRSALLRLANAAVFTSAHVGVGASLSPHAKAFRTLLREPRAREAFLELTGSQRPEAKLYGLAGLYLVDEPEFRVRATHLQASHLKAEILVGCNGSRSKFSTIIGPDTVHYLNLWDGSWPKDLAGS